VRADQVNAADPPSMPARWIQSARPARTSRPAPVMRPERLPEPDETVHPGALTDADESKWAVEPLPRVEVQMMNQRSWSKRSCSNHRTTSSWSAKDASPESQSPRWARTALVLHWQHLLRVATVSLDARGLGINLG
jgi:hypothetical protein